jgi:hypothetical protein
MEGTPIDLEEIAAAAGRMGSGRGRDLAGCVPALLDARATIIDEVETMRALLNPLVRAWDVLSQEDAAQLPPATREAWDRIVTAYAEADTWKRVAWDPSIGSPNELLARLEGSHPFDLSNGSMVAEVGEHMTTERPEQFRNFWGGAIERAQGRDPDHEPAQTDSPAWNDLPEIMSADKVDRIAILSAWALKGWRAQRALTPADWSELSTGIKSLVNEIRTWESRRTRLREAMAGAERLRTEAARPTKTLIDSGWDATITVRNPISRKARSTVSFDGERIPGREKKSTVGADVDTVLTYLRSTPKPVAVTKLRIPRSSARLVSETARKL